MAFDSQFHNGTWQDLNSILPVIAESNEYITDTCVLSLLSYQSIYQSAQSRRNGCREVQYCYCSHGPHTQIYVTEILMLVSVCC